MKKLIVFLIVTLSLSFVYEAKAQIIAQDTYTADTVLSGTAVYFSYPGKVKTPDGYATWQVVYTSDTSVSGANVQAQYSNDYTNWYNLGSAVKDNDSTDNIIVTHNTQYGLYYRIALDTDSAAVDTLIYNSGQLYIKE